MVKTTINYLKRKASKSDKFLTITNLTNFDDKFFIVKIIDVYRLSDTLLSLLLM